MSEDDARGLYDLFVPAFDGFEGAMLYGGTRMINLQENWKVEPGITEIPPLIRDRCPNARIHGVVPRTETFCIDSHGRLLISIDEDTGKATIIHPNQDEVLVVQDGPDKPCSWDGEYRAVLHITKQLREHAQWNSVLISYNGGKYTEEEVRAVRDRGWPIILIRGSGRKTDELAADSSFCSVPHVLVVDKNQHSLRAALEKLGVVPGFAAH